MQRIVKNSTTNSMAKNSSKKATRTLKSRPRSLISSKKTYLQSKSIKSTRKMQISWPLSATRVWSTPSKFLKQSKTLCYSACSVRRQSVRLWIKMPLIQLKSRICCSCKISMNTPCYRPFGKDSTKTSFTPWLETVSW